MRVSEKFMEGQDFSIESSSSFSGETLCWACAEIPIKLCDIRRELQLCARRRELDRAPGIFGASGEDGSYTINDNIYIDGEWNQSAWCKLCRLFRDTAIEYELKGQSCSLAIATEHGSSVATHRRERTDLGSLVSPWLQSMLEADLSSIQDGSDERNLLGGVVFRLRSNELSDRRCGYIALHQPNTENPGGLKLLSSRAINAEQIDWSMIRQWLQICDAHSCESEQTIRDFLPGFKVIDTTNRKIILAPAGCKYVALSYVWGTSTDSDGFDGSSLPNPVPLTIEDAIICTQALGLGFLWVDRFCIDREDAATKHAMIQNMDKIYEGATITLIDATGPDSISGMAGVSQAIRHPPERVEVRGELLSVVPNVARAVRISPWNSRGWTYQEGLLSGRRLIFTDSQAYFQCSKMHCCEVLAAEFRSGDATLWRDNLASSLQVFPRASRKVGEFNNRLEEYIQRQLTYDSDILNAFSGVLRKFWYAKSPEYHFWGLRIGPHGLLTSLLWVPWCVDPTKELSRRAGFPSWSWTGWRGITTMVDTNEKPRRDALHILASVEDVNGKRYTIQDYIENMSISWDISRYNLVIHLTGWVIDVSLVIGKRLSNEHITNVYVVSPTSKDIVARASILRPYIPGISISSKESVPSGTWLLLVYVTKLGLLGGIVLKHLEAGRYERAGVIFQSRKLELRLSTTQNEQTVRLLLSATKKGPRIWLKCRRQTIELV